MFYICYVCENLITLEDILNLKNIAIVMNILLLVMCVGFFISHGLPKSWILWTSSTVWFLAPIANLLYIYKK